MKPAVLTPRILLSNDTDTQNELQSPVKFKLFGMILRLLPLTASVFFTGAVVLGVKDGLDAMTVIESIMKLSALPIIALKGYVAGYSYAKDKLGAWCITKTKLLCAFLDTQKEGEENLTA